MFSKLKKMLSAKNISKENILHFREVETTKFNADMKVVQEQKRKVDREVRQSEGELDGSKNKV